jgi:hypothetical protein
MYGTSSVPVKYVIVEGNYTIIVVLSLYLIFVRMVLQDTDLKNPVLVLGRVGGVGGRGAKHKADTDKNRARG